MFERNNNAKKDAEMNDSKSTNNNKSGSGPSENMVSKGTEIIGQLITQSNIRIAGSVDGEAKVDGKVIVTSTGHIEGDVSATNADIAGKVEGEVHVDDKLALRQSAVVECDIYTNILVVEDGATFNGECHMYDNKSKTSKKSLKMKSAKRNKKSANKKKEKEKTND